MEELILNSIKVRSDLVGDYERTDNLKGFICEKLIHRVLRNHEEELNNYFVNAYNLLSYKMIMSPFYRKRYKRLLKDKIASKYIYEKYAVKQNCIDLLCSRVTDLSAKECIRLWEEYSEEKEEEDTAHFPLAKKILNHYINEIILILGNTKKK